MERFFLDVKRARIERATESTTNNEYKMFIEETSDI